MSHDFYVVIHINTKILIATNFIPLSAGETVNNNFEITVLALDIYTKYHNKPCKYELIRVKKKRQCTGFLNTVLSFTLGEKISSSGVEHKRANAFIW